MAQRDNGKVWLQRQYWLVLCKILFFSFLLTIKRMNIFLYATVHIYYILKCINIFNILDFFSTFCVN